MKLKDVFASDSIGIEIAAFEAMTGPARHKWDSGRDYKIDGCNVQVSLQGSVINTIKLVLNSKCSTDLSILLPNYSDRLPKTASQLTFGAFERAAGPGRYSADCLRACGNATAPMLYLTWQGSRADRGLVVTLGAQNANDATVGAASAWESAIEKRKGEDFLVTGEFNCGMDDLQPIIRKGLLNVRVTEIEIGYASTGAGC